MRRDMLVSIFSANYCRGKDRIGGSKAGGDYQGGEEIEVGN